MKSKNLKKTFNININKKQIKKNLSLYNYLYIKVFKT